MGRPRTPWRIIILTTEERFAQYKKKVCASDGDATLCARYTKIEKDKKYEVGVSYGETDEEGNPIAQFSPKDGLSLTNTSFCVEAGCMSGDAVTAHEIRHAYDYRYDYGSYVLDETDADKNPKTPVQSNGIEDEIRFLRINNRSPIRSNYDPVFYWWQK